MSELQLSSYRYRWLIEFLCPMSSVSSWSGSSGSHQYLQAALLDFKSFAGRISTCIIFSTFVLVLRTSSPTSCAESGGCSSRVMLSIERDSHMCNYGLPSVYVWGSTRIRTCILSRRVPLSYCIPSTCLCFPVTNKT